MALLLAACLGLPAGAGAQGNPLAPVPPARNTADKECSELFVIRYDKAAYVVRRLYHYGDRRDFLPYVGYLIAEHERLEEAAIAKGNQRAQGFGAAYWYSLVYGAANFGLRCHASAPGACEGPLDVKGKRGSRDPRRNIRYHVAEMYHGYLRGYRGLGLCKYVFFPAAPRDWGGGKFRRTEKKMRDCLARGQRLGKLGPGQADRNSIARGRQHDETAPPSAGEGDQHGEAAEAR